MTVEASAACTAPVGPFAACGSTTEAWRIYDGTVREGEHSCGRGNTVAGGKRQVLSFGGRNGRRGGEIAKRREKMDPNLVAGVDKGGQGEDDGPAVHPGDARVGQKRNSGSAAQV